MSKDTIGLALAKLAYLPYPAPYGTSGGYRGLLAWLVGPEALLCTSGGPVLPLLFGGGAHCASSLGGGSLLFPGGVFSFLSSLLVGLYGQYAPSVSMDPYLYLYLCIYGDDSALPKGVADPVS